MRRRSCSPTRVNHAGGGGSSPADFGLTLSGVTFLVNGTLNRPSFFLSPNAQGAVDNEARLQTWGAGGSGIANTGGGGGAAYSEEPSAPIGPTEAVVTAPVTPAGASGGLSSIGTLVSALGGQSPTGPQPGQGGQASGGVGSIRFSGANGVQGAGTQNGGGAAGSTANGSGVSGGAPNGGYAHNTSALSGFPGGGGSSTAGAAGVGRPGVNRITYQIPSLYGAPRIYDLVEQRDTADTVSRAVLAGLREAGDLLILEASCSGVPTVAAAAWATGSLVQINSAGLVCGRVFYRTATGDAGDDATVTTTAAEQVTSHMYTIKDAGGPPEWTTASGNNTTPTPPTHTNSFGNKPTLAIVSAFLFNNSGCPITGLPGLEGTLITSGNTDVGAALITCWRQFIGEKIVPGNFTMQVSTPWAAGTLVIPGV